MNRKDWRTVSAEDLDIDAAQLARQLVPLLRANEAEVHTKSAEYWVHFVKECKAGLSAVLPFTDSEWAFLDLLLNQGVIDSTLLTADASLQKRIQNQPLLEWKAINVRRHKGLA